MASAVRATVKAGASHAHRMTSNNITAPEEAGRLRAVRGFSDVRVVPAILGEAGIFEAGNL